MSFHMKRLLISLSYDSVVREGQSELERETWDDWAQFSILESHEWKYAVIILDKVSGKHIRRLQNLYMRGDNNNYNKKWLAIPAAD